MSSSTSPPKGKARAIVLSDSDSDDLSYFTMTRKKKARTARPLTPPRAKSPSPERSNTPTSDEDSDGVKRVKKRPVKRTKRKPQPVPIMHRIAANKLEPMTVGHIEPVKEVIPIVETDLERRRREIDEEFERMMAAEAEPVDPVANEARIKEAVRNHVAALQEESAMADDPSLPSNTTTLASPPASPPSTSRPDETVNLHIKMVADPAKKESGSERAVAAYEKRRVFRVNRRDPLTRVLGDLADRLTLQPNSLILEWRRGRIYYNTVSPFDLGIAANEDVDMQCYEKPIYNKIKGISERTASDESASARAADLAAAQTASAAKDENSDDVEVEDDKIVLKLCGKAGEARFNVRSNVTAGSLLKVYVKRVKLPKGADQGLRLVWDGETVGNDVQVKDMDVEAGDQLEVASK